MERKNSKQITRNNLRVGKSYFLRNHGETTSFLVLEAIGDDDYSIKDLLSLEIYKFSDLTKYGLGNDFYLNEIE